MGNRPLDTEFLKGQKFCVTGRLLCLTHAEFASFVRACGGVFLERPRRTGFTLVAGNTNVSDDELSYESVIFRRARRLKTCGYPIVLLSEAQFLEHIGLGTFASSLEGPHTIHTLSSMLDVSANRLRRWLRDGLIRPLNAESEIPLFDFHEVALIKQIDQRLREGATVQEIRRGIESARRRLPEEFPFAQHLSRIIADGTVLIRVGERLMDQTGQHFFDFQAADDPVATDQTLRSVDVDVLCDRAMELEDDKCFEEAESLYREAIALNPDLAVLHFDLGNVLFELGKSDEAIGCFEKATRLDPEFASAWHNLGSVHAHQARWRESERALRQSLRLNPDYVDTHQTLAEVLIRSGREHEARTHQDIYREHSFREQLGRTRETLLRVFR
ncbi:MAG: tetratricopeptide repeat protein [Planctomycetota bacterium]